MVLHRCSATYSACTEWLGNNEYRYEPCFSLIKGLRLLCHARYVAEDYATFEFTGTGVDFDLVMPVFNEVSNGYSGISTFQLSWFHYFTRSIPRTDGSVYSTSRTIVIGSSMEIALPS